MGDVLAVEVPEVGRFEPGQSGSGQFLDGLVRFRDGLEKEQDPFLARRIQVGRSNDVAIEYHPSGLESFEFEDGSVPSVERMLEYRYGDFGVPGMGLGGEDTVHDGMKLYTVGQEGEISVQTWSPEDKKNSFERGYRERKPATPEDLTAALDGLLNQHNALLAERKSHSVSRVTVPSLPLK